MNAHISYGHGLHEVCLGLGISQGQLEANRLDLRTDAKAATAKIANTYARLDAKFGDGAKRLDATQRHDAATAFVTSPLAEVLAPVEVVSNESFLFVPGKTGPGGPLLPLTQRVPLGKQEVTWDTLLLTGEARPVGAGGLNSLTRVGAAEDQKSQRVHMYGIRIGWDQFELWQAAHLPGRNVQNERNTAARQAMDEYLERVLSFGDLERGAPGFFSGGSAFTLSLPKSFGDPSLTFLEMFDQLAMMDVLWARSNPRRMVSGVVVPRTHWLNMLRIFNGSGGIADGFVNALDFAVKSFPWLANVIQDDRMLTANPDGGPMWQLYSADSSELYAEASATPMVFGPFMTELTTDIIMLGQTGGMVNKRASRIHRYYMPA